MSLNRFQVMFSVVLGLLISIPAFADSHVRIVRLSYMEGGVQIDRNTGQYEKAITNLPITEGAKLRTEADGRAEVEFEDGSTLRLAPNTTVQFPQLSLKDSGSKVSLADIQSGTVYADFAGSKGSQLTLKSGKESVNLTRAAHLRVVAGDNRTEIAVLKGDIQVEAPTGTTQAKKNQTLTFEGADAQPTIAKEIEPEPLDSWDQEQSQYHQRYASNSYGNYSPYAYGTADLSYYGSFFSAPGYGMLWQPYFIGASWDPFMDGAWAFTPGFGMGWVSAYPWGWVPYHYGSWVFLPGYGWAWQPGGVWMPWYSQPQILRAPNGFRPPQPPTTVAAKGTSIVPVNRGPVTMSNLRSANRLEIRNNSAGLGVPRGQVSNMAKVSHQVEQKGSVTQRIQPPSVQSMPATLGTDTDRRMGSPHSNSRPSTSPAPRSTAPPPSEPPMSAPVPSAPPSSPRPHR